MSVTQRDSVFAFMSKSVSVRLRCVIDGVFDVCYKEKRRKRRKAKKKERKKYCFDIFRRELKQALPRPFSFINYIFSKIPDTEIAKTAMRAIPLFCVGHELKV